MRRLLQVTAILIVSLFASEASNGAFSSFSVNGLSIPHVSANIQTCSAPCTQFNAVCDGVANDHAAFAAFNTWAIAQTVQVQLTIPNGATCMSNGTGEPYVFAEGIKDLLVFGYGATMSDNGGTWNGWRFGGRGQWEDNLHDTRILSVAAGASSVTVNPASASQPSACNSNATCTALFTVGQYALITGLVMQDAGLPSNAAYFEYVKILSVNASTGVITFTAPLTKSYLSTWPVYNVGDAFHIDQGGPATLYALRAWDIAVEYRGLTIDQTNAATQGQSYAEGRSATFTDVTVLGPGGLVPSQNQLWHGTNVTCTACLIETDKFNVAITYDNSTIGTISYQSGMSNGTLTIRNSTITTLKGTPTKAVLSDSTFGSLEVGSLGYGRTDEVICTNCAVTSFSTHGVEDKGLPLGSDPGINVAYTMSGGVISVPNGLNAVSWAVPGTNVMWAGAQASEGLGQVVSVAQDVSNTLITVTGLGSSFPTDPSMLDGGKLYIRVHPAPKFTCTGCSGAVAYLNSAPAAAPLFSYSSITSTGAQSAGTFGAMGTMWGNLSSLVLNVTNAYSGVGSLSFNLEEFGHISVMNSVPAIVFYGPSWNAKTAGSRTTTLSGTTPTVSGDSANVPDSTTTWFTGGQGSSSFSSNVTASCPGAGCPSVTVTIQTNQGVVNP